MKPGTKKRWIVIGAIATIVVISVLLTTVGKPLFSKSITAEKLDDFKHVCYGDKIANAADYTDRKSAVITSFYERPHADKNPWTNFSGVGAPNMAEYSEFTKANVVACFEYQPFAGKELARCDDDIKLKSAIYKTIFYEAKTGKKIAEGKDVVNDSSNCPSVFVYDKTSRETAKEPTSDTMIKAITEFVQ